MSFSFVSAILRGQWAIQYEYAQQVLPLVMKMISGETVKDFSFEKPKIENAIPLFNASTSGVFSVGIGTNLQSVPNESVVVYGITGPLMKYGGACSYGMVDHANAITGLANAPNVGAIILDIDSPGGQVAGTQMVADAIAYAGTQKPVIAVVNDGIAASAAMWIASAAQEIYLTTKNSQVGSIGVFTTLADYTGFYEKNGVKIREIYSRLSTDKNGIINEAMAGNDEPLLDELDIIAQSFIQTIQDNRGDRLTSEDWNTGKMFRAKEALKMGLIDGIKSMDQVVKRAQSLITNKSVQMSNKTVAIAGDAPVAFAAIMAAAGIDATQGITVVDQGFAMDEKNMNQLESVLTDHSAEIAQRDQTIEQLNERIAQLEANDQAQTIQSQANTIEQLNARISELEGQPDGAFGQTSKGSDDHGANPNGKYLTSYDQEKQRMKAMKG